MADTTTWGQLLCSTGRKPPIRLMKDSIKIGRTSDCDVSFLSNKYISAHHCTLSRDEDGKIWLTDKSTNGTVVNGRKLKKSKKIQLNHKDQIQLVKRKNEPNEDVVYIYQDLKLLQEEQYNLLDSTEEYGTDVTGTPELKNETSDSFDENKKEAEETKQGVEREVEVEVVTEEKPAESKDTMGESLVCSICQDIFHDCLSLQPCMHSFCSACYSQWMERSKECPTCRLPVERMSRNHIINNLVEAYLKEHPERKRSAEEMAEMDARNKITEEMIRPNRKRKRAQEVIILEEDEDDLSDDNSDYGSSDDTESDDGYFPAVMSPVLGLNSPQVKIASDMPRKISKIMSGITMAPTSFGSLFGFAPSISRPAPTVCRWCPGSRQNEASSSQASSSTASVPGISPGVSQPVCPDGSYHLMCLCCRKPMPKQENLPPLPGGTPYAKSQKCGICGNFYCNLLWRCDKPGCLGCLNEFKDLKFDNNCLDGVILNNMYESQILKNYLSDKNWTVQDLLSKCLEKLDAKSYSTTDCVMKPEMDSNFILCYSCGLKNLKELAFLFRRDIPREDLPAAVTSRPDCHWGKNCRTQRNPNNPHHASRFNHVCEQTRFR